MLLKYYNEKNIAGWEELLIFLDGEIVEECEIWNIARENQEIPNFDNIVLSMTFDRIISELNELGVDSDDIDYYIDGSGTSLSIATRKINDDFEDVYNVYDLKRILKEKGIEL